MNAYDEIQLMGMIGDDYLNEIPIGNQDAPAAEGVAAVFDLLGEGLAETLMGELDSEPMLWAFVNLFHHRRHAVERERDRIGETIKTLIRQFDGSEVGDSELQEAQQAFERTDERAIALGFMLNVAAEAYEGRFNKTWRPRSGSVTNRATTAAMLDARDFVNAVKERETAAKCPEGARVVISGGADFTDHEAIWTALDRTRDRLGDMVLLHGGAAKGVDHIASLWAKARDVPQVWFKPDFQKDRKAAPFKRNDAMLAMKPRAVILFPGNGINENVGQKAAEMKIPVWRPVKPD